MAPRLGSPGCIHPTVTRGVCRQWLFKGPGLGIRVPVYPGRAPAGDRDPGTDTADGHWHRL
eukprot:530510-Rhodomonas_salina.3